MSLCVIVSYLQGDPGRPGTSGPTGPPGEPGPKVNVNPGTSIVALDGADMRSQVLPSGFRRRGKNAEFCASSTGRQGKSWISRRSWTERKQSKTHNHLNTHSFCASCTSPVCFIFPGDPWKSRSQRRAGKTHRNSHALLHGYCVCVVFKLFLHYREEEETMDQRVIKDLMGHQERRYEIICNLYRNADHFLG